MDNNTDALYKDFVRHIFLNQYEEAQEIMKSRIPIIAGYLRERFGGEAYNQYITNQVDDQALFFLNSILDGNYDNAYYLFSGNTNEVGDFIRDYLTFFGVKLARECISYHYTNSTQNSRNIIEIVQVFPELEEIVGDVETDNIPVPFNNRDFGRIAELYYSQN